MQVVVATAHVLKEGNSWEGQKTNQENRENRTTSNWKRVAVGKKTASGWSARPKICDTINGKQSIDSAPKREEAQTGKRAGVDDIGTKGERKGKSEARGGSEGNDIWDRTVSKSGGGIVSPGKKEKRSGRETDGE